MHSQSHKPDVCFQHPLGLTNNTFNFGTQHHHHHHRYCHGAQKLFPLVVVQSDKVTRTGDFLLSHTFDRPPDQQCILGKPRSVVVCLRARTPVDPSLPIVGQPVLQLPTPTARKQDCAFQRAPLSTSPLPTYHLSSSSNTQFPPGLEAVLSTACLIPLLRTTGHHATTTKILVDAKHCRLQPLLLPNARY